MRRRRTDEVPSITTAASPRSSMIDRRERDYLLSMLVRTICFVGFVFIDHPIRWVLAVGAVFLPYVAVVVGNATIRQAGDGPSPFGYTHGELQSGAHLKDADTDAPTPAPDADGPGAADAED